MPLDILEEVGKELEKALKKSVRDFNKVGKDLGLESIDKEVKKGVKAFLKLF